MKKRIILFAVSLSIAVSLFIFYRNIFQEPKNKMAELRAQHEKYLRNSPFKKTLQLSKAERKSRGLPPNKYFERQWELTMDPATGKPEQKRVLELQERLRQRALFAKVPGENTNSWVERGPNNVGGRTRAIMFDPNDINNKRVFAGGVSGGLWVNNDITNANSAWTEVNIPKNLAISCMAYDPNNTNVFYVGTGESYVQGDVNGNGLWKSTDGGTNWSRVFGGVTGETTFETNAKLTVNSPGSIAGDYQVSGASYGPPLTSITGNLVLVDDGTSFPNRGCSALINGSAVNGNIAVVERGDCNFTVKVKNAQNEGALAVLVVNNASGPPITLGGDDPSISIPSVMISKNEGQSIIGQLVNGVNVTMASVASAVLGNYVTPGIHHINDVKIRNVGGVSEVYVAAAAAFYPDANPSSIFGVEDYGLYKSTNNGSSWSKVNLPSAPGGSVYQPNDIEFSIDNTVWVSTTRNLYGAGGGAILSSSDGVTFNLEKTITDGLRTQIDVSSVDPDKLYVLVQKNSDTNPVEIIMTDDGFVTELSLTLPDDVDTGIPAEDFARGQAFYNLMLEIDPINDAVVYVGGIDLFRSSDSGASWSQISKWSNNNDLGALSVPLVHADQHALVFDSSNSNNAIVGNDGGVYYATGLSTTPVIDSRNKNYNTVQFYKGGIGQEVAADKIIGGSQDNGTLFTNGVSGLNAFSDINNGGDGCYVFVDRDNEYLIASFVYNSYTYKSYATGASVYTIDSDQDSGDFVNPAALDSGSNYLYTNATVGATYQINRYKLGSLNTPPPNIVSNVLLDGSPTAFLVSPFVSNQLFVGTDNGKLFKLSNAISANVNSIIWDEITGDDFYGSISCVQLGASENDVFVTFYNYGVPSIFYSSDAGLTWLNKEGNLPDLPVRAVMMNPLNPDEVILGTDLGVWATSNFNATDPNWQQSQNGMKDVKVTSFDLRSVDNIVLASTYGRGMFTGQFTDGGALSTNQNDMVSKIKLYPTVSNGTLTISSNAIKGKIDFQVFNLNGKQMYGSELELTENNTRFSLNHLSSGLYLVKFTSGDFSEVKKIIIQ